MKKPATKAEKEYLSRVADLSCLICQMPAEIHHITTARGFGGRASHYDTLPLCPFHHRLGNRGEAVHAGVKTWEERFGTQKSLVKKVQQILGYEGV